MKELRYESQNGRWGLSVIVPAGTIFPAQGKMESLGKSEGLQVFRFTPEEDGGVWWWISTAKGGVSPLAGCQVVAAHDLQGGNSVALLAGRSFFAVREDGYRGRSSCVVAFSHGEKVPLTGPMMMALGLIESESTPVTPEIPGLSGAMAIALRDAGL